MGFERTFVGLDVHARSVVACGLDDRTGELSTAQVAVDALPYGRMLPGVRGVRLTVLRVEAKFKYDDHNPVEHRERVIGHLETARSRCRRRGLSAVGDWETHRSQP